MAEYERINFRKKWYNEIEKYLKNNPELGFDPDDVKYFIKYAVKKQMAQSMSEEEKITKLIEELRKEKD